MVGKRGFV